MSNTSDLTELLENVGFDAENIGKAKAIFEQAVLDKVLDIKERALVADIKEGLDASAEVRADEFVGALDDYLDESVDDIRKLMILAVSQLGGPGAVDAFMKKVAALAREGALSAASSEWAQGSPDDSTSNRDSIRGGGVAARKEEIEAEEAAAVFEQVAAGLSEDDADEFLELVGDITYSGDAPRLRSQLTTIRNQNFASPLTENYCAAISRTVRRG
jgi:hypothetical protein